VTIDNLSSTFAGDPGLAHYHVGYRQPGRDPEGEVTTFATLVEATEQNKINAEEALEGLNVDPDDDWRLSGPDEDGDYFVTLYVNGSESFAWHYFVEPCNDARQHYALMGEDEPAPRGNVDPLTFKGQPVWSLAVRVSDGTVLAGFPIAQAVEADFHVDFYWPAGLIDGYHDNTVAFACYNVKDPNPWLIEDSDKPRPELLSRILEQVAVRDLSRGQS